METQQLKNFGVHFYLKIAKEDSNGLSPIQARITVNGVRTELSISRKCKQDEWCSKKALPSGKSAHIADLNRYLTKVTADINEVYEQLRREKVLITSQLIKSRYLGGELQEPTLRTLIDKHYTAREKDLSEGTLKNYRVTNRYLKAFIRADAGTDDIFLSQVTIGFITRFELWLKEQTDDSGQQALQQNSVMKQLERLRRILKMAIKLEWVKSNPFEAYELSYKKSKPKYLHDWELSQLENTPIEDCKLDRARDLFIFSCYTGLAWTDARNLNAADIMPGIDGCYWLIDSRDKTDTAFRVPLLPKALEILEKYKNHPACRVTGKLLPMYSNQKMNEYLKVAAQLCAVNKKLTYHMARHTFGTTVTLSNGVPIETVSKMLGHEKLSTTQMYAFVIDQKISDDMAGLHKKYQRTKSPVALHPELV